jgi:2-ketoarginine methyltransferase
MPSTLADRTDPSVTKKICAHAHAAVDPHFEQRLIESIKPISNHYLAICLHHIFDTGVFDELAQNDQPIYIASIAKKLKMDVNRLTGLLLFLRNEGVVNVEDNKVVLTATGRQYGEFKAWYTIMIGGYSSTIQQIGSALFEGSPFCSRDGRYVGLGSCEMSRFDGMPITKTLLQRANLKCREMLDLGCGNALYLVDFCHNMPELRAWGVEPDFGGYEEACKLVRQANMQDRIFLHNSSTTKFLQNPPERCKPDLMVLGFVLHEILAQEGERAVIDLLRSVTDQFRQINIVVIEVIDEIENPQYMEHGLAKNFWNPYYLIHYFTLQKLEKKKFWETLFEAAGLKIVDLITTDPNVDSSGLELGYLLRRR